MVVVGIDPNEIVRDAILPVTTVILSLLAVGTRLGRYIIQELFGWKGAFGMIAGTLITMALGIAIVVGKRWPMIPSSTPQRKIMVR